MFHLETKIYKKMYFYLFVLELLILYEATGKVDSHLAFKLYPFSTEIIYLLRLIHFVSFTYILCDLISMFRKICFLEEYKNEYDLFSQ